MKDITIAEFSELANKLPKMTTTLIVIDGKLQMLDPSRYSILDDEYFTRIFKDALLDNKFEFPDEETLNNVKLYVEKEIGHNFNDVKVFYFDELASYVLQLPHKNFIIKNSELVVC